jgi:DNA-binding MarR family transcriptional regulator
MSRKREGNARPAAGRRSQPAQVPADSGSSPDLLTLADRLHSTAIAVLRHVRSEDTASGLTAARLSALSVIVFAGPVTMSQLADAEQVSVPTISRMIAGMVEDGLVRRQPDTADRRVVWLHPTARGSRLLNEGRRRRVEALARLLSGVDPVDRRELARAADRLLTALGRE